jgi:hypothetical protein
MMAPFIRLAVLTISTLACVLPARADWLSCLVDGTKEFCHTVVRDTKRRNCWPEPFLRPDRHAVRAPLALMVSNGWRRQNMLADHHFVEQSGDLTEAGRMKVQWILTEAPQHHRTIYVHKAGSPEITAARIDKVQQLAAQLVPEGELPLVLETGVAVQGWSAAQADTIGRKFKDSIPDPRLPKASSSSGGGEKSQ